jgi:hypothetical protein
VTATRAGVNALVARVGTHVCEISVNDAHDTRIARSVTAMVPMVFMRSKKEWDMMRITTTTTTRESRCGVY